MPSDAFLSIPSKYAYVSHYMWPDFPHDFTFRRSARHSSDTPVDDARIPIDLHLYLQHRKMTSEEGMARASCHILDELETYSNKWFLTIYRIFVLVIPLPHLVLASPRNDAKFFWIFWKMLCLEFQSRILCPCTATLIVLPPQFQTPLHSLLPQWPVQLLKISKSRPQVSHLRTSILSMGMEMI